MGSNENKAATLGMPHGTATNRLRKNILFHLLKKHGENTCHACGELIQSVEALSIEHKKPWEGISAELFWDLDNIAFSHLHCNRPHRLSGGGWNKITAPEGKQWCGVCKSFKESVNFTEGAKGECQSCKTERNALRDRRKVPSEVGIMVARDVANV
jgi:hypothetical protein